MLHPEIGLELLYPKFVPENLNKMFGQIHVKQKNHTNMSIHEYIATNSHKNDAR